MTQQAATRGNKADRRQTVGESGRKVYEGDRRQGGTKEESNRREGKCKEMKRRRATLKKAAGKELKKVVNWRRGSMAAGRVRVSQWEECGEREEWSGLERMEGYDHGGKASAQMAPHSNHSFHHFQLIESMNQIL